MSIPNIATAITSQSTGTGAIGISTGTGVVNTMYGQPIVNEDFHRFDCKKVQNGWTLEYRGKQYIAVTLDELMDQMKAAMVAERIST